MFYFLDGILLRLQSARRVATKPKTPQTSTSAGESTNETSSQSKNHPWVAAHQETNVSRNRAVTNAAMNHWFVCNKGFPNRCNSMTYDPSRSFTEAIGKDTSLSNFDRMWDTPPAKVREGNEHANFWRDFGQMSRSCQPPVNPTDCEVDDIGGDSKTTDATKDWEMLALSLDESKGTKDYTARTLEELHSVAILTLDEEKSVVAALELELGFALSQALPKLDVSETAVNANDAECTDEVGAPSIRASDILSLTSAHELTDSTLEQALLSPKTPESFIRKLSQAAQPEIRAAVALAPAATEEILSALVKDPSVKVRCMLAQNHQVSMNILRQLMLDENPFVAFTAKKTIDKRKKLMSHAN